MKATYKFATTHKDEMFFLAISSVTKTFFMTKKESIATEFPNKIDGITEINNYFDKYFKNQIRPIIAIKIIQCPLLGDKDENNINDFVCYGD